MMSSRFWARTALAAALGFLVLLASLHFLEPEFDPSTRMISEYELGRHGWVMSLAFFALGGSVLATLLSTSSGSTSRRSVVGRACFLAIGVALIGGGIFYPYQPATVASYLHGLCGVIVIVAFPIAATLYGSGLAHRPPWKPSQRALRWATMLVWLGLLSFVASTIVFGLSSLPVDRSNPSLPI